MDIRQFDRDRILEQMGAQRFLFAVTRGFDKKPQQRLTELCYQEEGVMYFACPKSETFYGELSMNPEVLLSCYDRENDVAITVRGSAVFTEDSQIIASCLKNSSILSTRWGNEPQMLIAWFIKDGEAEVSSLRSGESVKISLGTPDSVLIGISIKKDNEIRDRLTRIMERREAEDIKHEDQDLQKLYDGALMYFAQTAKKVWPRMDIRPIERSAQFETYDEMEDYMEKARRLIGNAQITKPEDLTYWLNKETLSQLEASENVQE